MVEPGVRDLRDHLSRYLERLQAGEELTVTDRGRPVSRLVPVGSANLTALIGAQLADLAMRPAAQCVAERLAYRTC